MTGTATRAQYIARYSHDGRAWVVQFDDPDVSTYARSLTSAMKYAREALAVTLDYDSVEALEVEADVVDVIAGLPDELGEKVLELRHRRAQAEDLTVAVAGETRDYAKRLLDAGLTVRDVAAALQVTPSRISQIAAPGHPRSRSRSTQSSKSAAG